MRALNAAAWSAFWSMGLALIVLSGSAFAQSTPFKPTLEQETDRPGENYRDFRLSLPTAVACQSVCLAEEQCRAWTYTNRPDGPHCWLKSKVAPARKAAGYVSGVVRPDGPMPAEPRVVVKMAIRSSAPDIKRCVDVPNGKIEPGVRLQLWDCNAGDAQLFSYVLGTQHLVAGRLCAQVSGNGRPGDAVVLGPCSGDPKQSWKIEFKDKRAQFTGVNGLCLDIKEGNLDNGTPMQVWDCNGSLAQLWHFTRVDAP